MNQLGSKIKVPVPKMSPFELVNIEDEKECNEQSCKKNAYIYFFPTKNYYCWYHSFKKQLCT